MNPPRLPHTPMSARYLDTPIGEKVREIIDGFGFTQPKAKTVSAGTRTVTFSFDMLMPAPFMPCDVSKNLNARGGERAQARCALRALESMSRGGTKIFRP